MRVNSDQSIKKALTAHQRFGSWQAVREAAQARTQRPSANGQTRERATTAGQSALG